MGGLTVVGLGPGGPELLTREAEQALAAAGELRLRTRRHPTVDALDLGAAAESFDALYERAGSLEEVYRAIAERLVELARRGTGVVYAVPGRASSTSRSAIAR